VLDITDRSHGCQQNVAGPNGRKRALARGAFIPYRLEVPQRMTEACAAAASHSLRQYAMYRAQQRELNHSRARWICTVNHI
jgi:hypothetical protein